MSSMKMKSMRRLSLVLRIAVHSMGIQRPAHARSPPSRLSARLAAVRGDRLARLRPGRSAQLRLGQSGRHQRAAQRQQGGGGADAARRRGQGLAGHVHCRKIDAGGIQPTAPAGQPSRRPAGRLPRPRLSVPWASRAARAWPRRLGRAARLLGPLAGDRGGDLARRSRVVTRYSSLAALVAAAVGAAGRWLADRRIDVVLRRTVMCRC